MPGCAPDARVDEPLGQASDAIINGAPDTTHQSVVAYLHDNGKCSATIIAVNGSEGYALTAGHCLGATLGKLHQGNDHNKPSATYTVTASAPHPEYTNSTLYDFAMLKFSGATAQTPITAVLTPKLDVMKTGSSLDLVGFGKIQDIPNGGDTSLRHHKVLPTAATTKLRLIFDQANGGVCFGDSGGPAIFTSSGTEYVGGVHSGVTGSCTSQGISVRASAVLDSFITPFIKNLPYTKESCGECSEAHVGAGKCSAVSAACFGASDCQAYYDCISGCGTNACVSACADAEPSGAAKYNLILACLCDTGCVTECGSEPMCNPPACGLPSSKTACQDCYEANCCAEASACSKSSLCTKCITSAFPPSECDTDPSTQAFTTCLSASCSSECNVAAPTSSASTGAGGDSATSTVGVGGASTVGAGGSGGSDANSGAGAGDAFDPIVVESGCAIGEAIVPARRNSLASILMLVMACLTARRIRVP